MIPVGQTLNVPASTTKAAGTSGATTPAANSKSTGAGAAAGSARTAQRVGEIKSPRP